MIRTVAASPQSIMPRIKQGVMIGAVVIGLAALIYLIWGRFALLCYAAVLSCALMWKLPAMRMWGRVELKGVLIAVAATAFPIFGYSGVLASAYLGINVLLNNLRQDRTISSLEQLNREQGEIVKSLEATVKALDDVAKKLEAQVLKMAESTPQFKAVLESMQKAREETRATEALVAERFVPVEQMIDYVAKLNEAVQASGDMQEIQKLIEQWKALTLQAEEQSRQIEQRQKELAEAREGFEKEVTAFRAERQQFGLLTAGLARVVET